MESLDFVATDGQIIKCFLFKPTSSPKAVVQIVHGLEEHGLRYKNFAEFLSSHGYIVFSSDQRLHGLTAGEELGKTKIKDVFPVMVQDQLEISKMLKAKFDLPLVIFGHSYGSFIVQRYIQLNQNYTCAILSGSAYMKRLDTLAGKILSYWFVKIKGGEKTSKKIENLIIGSFNRALKGKGDWISANKKNVEEYESDPLCGAPLCSNFYYSMFKNARKLYREKEMNKIDKNAPLLIVSGQDDPVGKMGRSVTKLFLTYKKLGINCKIKLFKGLRHEILNEDKKEVQQTILKFIEKSMQKQN